MIQSTVKTVLLAEDSNEDTLLLRRTLQKSGVPARLHAFRDGRYVIEYLRRMGEFADRERYPWPDLLLLDLKMDGIGGFEVLEWLRSYPLEAELAVAVLSGSELPEDRVRAELLGAASYIVKPITPQQIRALLSPSTQPTAPRLPRAG